MILGPQGPGKVGQRGGFFVAGVAQLVEHYLAKVDVASSNLVSRSISPSPSCPYPAEGETFCCLGLQLLAESSSMSVPYAA